MSHLVITIGCEYGAKGNQIGKQIAEDLGFKFYDRNTVDAIIHEVQKERNEESFHNTQILQNVRFMYRKRLSVSCRTENPV